MTAAGSPAGPQLPGALPRYQTTFIGRQRELEQLADLFGTTSPRLLSLVGPGGIGKTRLAVCLAEKAESRLEDGIVWVDLSEVSESAWLGSALATALDLGEAPGETLEDRLFQALAPRQTMVILDNCEHLLSAVRAIVSWILEGCDRTTVVVTSRELLNIPGEVVWPVPPLALDPTEFGDEKGTGADAVRVFVERAESAGRFRSTRETLPIVGNICRLLDGLPLAIELAAAQTRTLGVAQIEARLREDDGLPSRRSAITPERHRSLHDTIEWSYRLLTEPERTLLRRLSVFQGPFSVEAAEAIAGDTEDLAEVDEVTVVGVLTSLVDKSMASVVDGIPSAYRFRLLESMRRFAEQKLIGTEPVEELRQRHYRFYYDLAADAADGLRGSDQASWLQRLRAEEDNLRAALAFGLQSSHTDEGNWSVLALGCNLFWYWNSADLFAEGLRWMERLLAIDLDSIPDQLLGQAYWTAGTLAWLLGDLNSAVERLGEARDIFARIDDRIGVARAEMNLGRVRLYRGDAARAAALLEASATTLSECGPSIELALALTGLGVAGGMLGDRDRALEACREALRIFQKVGDPFFVAVAVGDLGWICYLTGDSAGARYYLEESLNLRRRLESTWLLAQTLNQLAEVERYAGHADAARIHLEEGLALAEDVGARAWIAASMRDLGFLAVERGDYEQATASLATAAEYFHELGDEPGIAQCLEALAGTAQKNGYTVEAGVLATAAAPFRSRSGSPASPAARKGHEWFKAALGRDAAEGSYETAHSVEFAIATARELVAGRSRAWVKASAVIRIRALGAVSVERSGTTLRPADWTYAKPRQLLFFLLDSEPCTRNEIGLAFWPESSHEQVRRNLRSALYHLRRALGSREWIIYEEGRYRFNRDLQYWYDVEEFEDLCAEADRCADDAAGTALELLSRAVDLYDGDFVADVEDDNWALPRREQLRRRWVGAMLDLAALEDASGDDIAAAESYYRLVQREPLHDAAHVAFMSNLASRGDRSGALRHYEQLITRLKEEFGAVPGPDVVRLAHTLRVGGDA